MLPFLQKKDIVSGVISRRPKHQSEIFEQPDSEQGEPDLVMHAQALIDAIHNNSALEVAEAFKACFEACEEAPHEEGPHIPEEQEI